MTQITLILLKLAVCLGTVSLVLLSPISSSAQCKCIPGPQVRFKGSDHVFVAAIASVEKRALRLNGIYYDRIRLTVRDVWKKQLPKTIAVLDRTDSMEPLLTGESWVVFASLSGDGRLKLDRHCCSWTRELEASKRSGEYQAITHFAGNPKPV